MGRHKASVGGWFKMWSRLWLSDEKIRDLKLNKKQDLIADLIDLFCLANECMSDGRFEFHGMSFTHEMVSEKYGISIKNINELARLGFINLKPFSIKNWERYQNQDSKRNFITDLKPDKKHL